ncbi:thiamine pyrophosphate-dependent enzyme, partial [Falsiroseomonas oryzae]|uniref:thiamine pyrophosphate-dependent enzyme n=1 Tax=Falsiroseomonas oryzae TaxID=2766473 RepID=UPI0022EB6C68
LAATLPGARLAGRSAPRAARHPPVRGALSPPALARVLAASLPDGAVLVSTALTASLAYAEAMHLAPPHTVLGLTGGGLDQGPALAVGAAIACPGRKVVNLLGDGSAAYLPQAFWTQARESLGIVTLIVANRRYALLRREEPAAGGVADRLTRLEDPAVDWCAVARGFGVPACRVDTAEDLSAALHRSLDATGPVVIEALL